MSEDRNRLVLMNKLDKLLDEYSQERRSMREADPEEFSCKFKDNCYTAKFNMGNCPCELCTE